MTLSLPPVSTSELTEVRAHHPELISAALKQRKRPPLLGEDGRLFIIAADHPARGALGSGRNPSAMANREDLLQRLAAALDRPGVDGVLGTADVLEDLALMGALDNKVVVGSMNRGGLQGSTFEVDDRYTSYQVTDLVDQQLDMGKLLLRMDLSNPATANMLDHTAAQVREAAKHQLPIIVEPFLSRTVDGALQNQLDPESVITSIAIASGLGGSSAYTWLKLPVVSQMERVMEASTLPTLLLGGNPEGALEEAFSRWEHALALPHVRGLMVGRTLLYPQDDDVISAVDAAARLVHTSLEVS